MKGWRTVSLGDFADSVDYGVTASATQQPSGPKFLRITDIQNGEVNWGTVPWCECDARSAANSRLKPGDIVFARTGATTGKSFLIRECPEDAVFASYLIRVRVGDSVEPCYLSHFFNSPDYWAQITQSARGVAQPGVNASSLKTLKIPLPPLTEQKRIAAILDKADSIRRKRQEAVRLTEELLRSVFLDMFGDPVTNPKGWEIRPLGQLIAEKDKINYGVVQPGDDFLGGIPVVRVGDFINGSIDKAKLKTIDPAIDAKYKKSRLVGDEVLIACVGSIGAIALADESLAGFNIVRAVARVRPGKKLLKEYLASYLLTPFPQSHFAKETRTVSQPTLNISLIEETPLILPPIELQKDFVNAFYKIHRIKNGLTKSHEVSDFLFKSLMQSAFKGNL